MIQDLIQKCVSWNMFVFRAFASLKIVPPSWWSRLLNDLHFLKFWFLYMKVVQKPTYKPQPQWQDCSGTSGVYLENQTNVTKLLFLNNKFFVQKFIWQQKFVSWNSILLYLCQPQDSTTIFRSSLYFYQVFNFKKST